VSDSLVSLIERGHAGTLSANSLRDVAAVLDIRMISSLAGAAAS
jgi:hypothetical protein